MSLVDIDDELVDGMNRLAEKEFDFRMEEDDEKEFADLAEHPFSWEPTVFSGPFMLQEWVKDNYVTVVRNPDYATLFGPVDQLEEEVARRQALPPVGQRFLPDARGVPRDLSHSSAPGSCRPARRYHRGRSGAELHHAGTDQRGAAKPSRRKRSA